VNTGANQVSRIETDLQKAISEY